MITFTEDERRFLFSLVNDLYQNWNFRSLEGNLLQGILTKLKVANVQFTESENRRCQFQMRDALELYNRIADPRLQHILQGQAGPGSGVGAVQMLGGVGAPGGGASSYFDGASMANFCRSILTKLEGDVGP